MKFCGSTPTEIGKIRKQISDAGNKLFMDVLKGIGVAISENDPGIEPKFEFAEREGSMFQEGFSKHAGQAERVIFRCPISWIPMKNQSMGLLDDLREVLRNQVDCRVLDQYGCLLEFLPKRRVKLWVDLDRYTDDFYLFLRWVPGTLAPDYEEDDEEAQSGLAEKSPDGVEVRK